MKQASLCVIFIIIVFVIGVIVGYDYSVKRIPNAETSFISYPVYKTIKDTVYLNGTIEYSVPFISPPSSSPIPMRNETVTFKSYADTVFSDSTGIDSVAVSYAYPENIFMISKNSHRRTIINKTTKNPTKERSLRVCTFFDLTKSNLEYGVGSSIGVMYKNVIIGVCGNSNKQVGIRLGYCY